jgi:hypothetical protein
MVDLRLLLVSVVAVMKPQLKPTSTGSRVEYERRGSGRKRTPHLAHAQIDIEFIFNFNAPSLDVDVEAQTTLSQQRT